MTTSSIHMVREETSRLVAGRSLAEAAALLDAESEVFIVHDAQVSAAAGTLAGVLGPALRGCFSIAATEAGKTLSAVTALHRRLLEAGASRKAFLVALGGGITTDLTGFVAATYKRGIRYGNIPTTLLAQVDAAIGGKTGVNLDGYKNMVGAFHLPAFTYLCPEVLSTLPPSVFREGLSELLKTFLIADGTAYAAAVDTFAGSARDGLPSDAAAVGTLIRQAAQIKADIVGRDPFEKGERAVLNLGHSFGHALEHEAQTRGDHLSHGAAVAIGTCLAAELSQRLGVAEQGLSARLRADFQRVGLPVDSPCPVPDLLPALGKDKKASGTHIRFVLPVRPGQVLLKNLPIETLAALLCPAASQKR